MTVGLEEQIAVYLTSLGFPPRHRFRVFIEGARAMRSYWTDDDCTFDRMILANYEHRNDRDSGQE